MAEITFDEVGKVYGGVTRAISDVSIDVGDGEFVVFVGPSGCGKSTLLRMVAGLEDITEGEIKIGDRVVNEVAPKDRDIAMVFQNYALYPHMTVRDNMAFGLKLRKTQKDEIEERVAEAARVLEITDYLDRKPKALSGGQRQRVAMGRAIVREPAAFLMDEPLSNLDAKLRVQMRSELGMLHSRLKTTTLYVTHDQVEAMTMGDRVAVLKAITGTESNLQQIAAPRTLYDHPINLFVAGFIGSPAMNFVYATASANGTSTTLDFGGHSLTVGSGDLPQGLAEKAGDRIIMGIRPEAFEISSAAGSSNGNTMNVNVNLVEQLGSEAYVHFEVPSPPVVTADIEVLLAEEGTDADSLGDETRFTARVNPDHAPRSGQSAELVVDTSKLHFFDLENGDTI
ncbi:MAG: sn-glycerol-3-phosphate ABC transporter ATP-binding protein UgpC [Acidimicrobiia bacterium]|nr:sn-glycerol-3-phosphate ABC transporter ATP-binding protein UgpC [bacterium]MXZ07415.1 sn-glycerol-3-phosphate ABC transporter ATP-binding protein UgpC [Acidimicrobiia bacterium]MCY3579117.1 sn-glycerol-3-phosphate ABC transporter ATP-binding protein UgpC [bacterium]MCY3653183.1 sn-glycerol-3-phosphate ABC transporter ATP-binding protein UgpC [bacterium]MDE0642657.1 sn-glycerol-3-phosphate ABC transporter ATP-binding protein UgpC [bacterium]